MLSFLLGLHFLLAVAIIGLILLQKHDSDGALGSSGGGAASGMFTIRGQANILTRATGTLMAVFILNCLVMAKIAKNAHMVGRKESLIDKVARESIKPAETEENGKPFQSDTAPSQALKTSEQPVTMPATQTPAANNTNSSQKAPNSDGTKPKLARRKSNNTK